MMYLKLNHVVKEDDEGQVIKSSETFTCDRFRLEYADERGDRSVRIRLYDKVNNHEDRQQRLRELEDRYCFELFVMNEKGQTVDRYRWWSDWVLASMSA